ncbi:MAG: YlbF family regulator [Clostridia bacterium]|nr:YlbF family regulator [Clostridia bacterium]
MDIIQMVRELGAALQQDERYLRLVAAEKANDADADLNEKIAQLHMLQLNYQHEASKENPDDAKLEEFDRAFGSQYAEIMQNPNMKVYEQARGEIDALMRYISAILGLCLQGEDPATCEPAPEPSGCSGNCGSCGGCG